MKEFLESLFKGEIMAFLEENEGIRKDNYKRDLRTQYRKINDQGVSRYRDNEFQNALFDIY